MPKLSTYATATPVGTDGVPLVDDLGGTPSTKLALLSAIKTLVLTAVDSVTFTPQASAPAHAEGLLFYDDATESLSYYNEATDVTVNVGQESLVRIYNDTGSTIPDGTPVYVIGSHVGTLLPTVAAARADDLATSNVVAVTTHDIATASAGYATTMGAVRGIDTSAFNNGDILYLSPNTAGALTATKPTSPDRIVVIGTVIRKNAIEGIILVMISDLSDAGGGGSVTKATAANIRAGTADTYVTSDGVEAAAEEVTLTDGANIAVDWSTLINGNVTLAGNRTLDLPSNGEPGTSRKIRVIQDATGSRTLTFAAGYKHPGGAAPTLSTAAAAVDVLEIYCVNTTEFYVFSALGMA